MVLGTIFLVSLFSSNLFAQEEDVTVYNNLDYPIIAVFKAVGYVGKCCGYYTHPDDYRRVGDSTGNSTSNCVDLVDEALEVPANGSVTHKYGAGTSGRHVILGLPGESVTPELLTSISGGHTANGYDASGMWDVYLVNKDILINDEEFYVDHISKALLPLYVELIGHGCDYKFKVVGHGSGTLTVNDIYFTGRNANDYKTYFDAYCDCEKTED